MKQQNIYSNNNQLLKDTLSKYKPGQLLYIPIEIGKFNHKASIVNFFGDIIVNVFEFANTKHGLNFFLKKLKSAKKDSNAKKLFIGCESTGHYHLNLIHHIKLAGFDAQIINPRDTKAEKSNKNAKTDPIDLQGIARTLIGNKGGRQIVPQGIYYNLQRAARSRRKFVNRKTSSKNIITSLVDRIFPGLWDKDNSIFSKRFSKSSLLLLEHYPHPQKVTQLGVAKLAQFFRKHNTKLGEATAKKVIVAAKNSITKSLDDLDTDIKVLKQHIQCYNLYESFINDLELQMTQLLIQTPGIYLLSVNGISIIYAAEFTAEVGDINRFAYANQIISYAGSCSKKYQSAEFEAQNLPISGKGNKFLRTTINQAALALNAWCKPFSIYYSKKSFEKPDRPGIARIATGNKFVKLAFALMKHQQLFKPIGHISDYGAYYQSIWDKILRKLDNPDLSLIPNDNNYLLDIKSFLENNYGLKLALKS